MSASSSRLSSAQSPPRSAPKDTSKAEVSRVARSKRNRIAPTLVETEMIERNEKHPLAGLDVPARQEQMVASLAQVLTQIAQQAATQPAQQQQLSRTVKRPKRP